MQKALLNALLLPSCELAEYQTKANFTRMLAVSEETKTLPFGEVWDEYCRRCGVPVGMDWLLEAEKYESEVLSLR
jgi:L-rhamnose isomerase